VACATRSCSGGSPPSTRAPACPSRHPVRAPTRRRWR
jgi:hypothetical protein